MKRSPQSPAGSVSSSCAPTPTPLAASWNSNNSSIHNNNNLRRRISPTINSYHHLQDDAEHVDEDLFGSSARRKQRGKRLGKVGQQTGDNVDPKRNRSFLVFPEVKIKHWAVVKVIEQRVRELSTQMANMFENFSAKADTYAAPAGGQNGAAVGTANGSPTSAVSPHGGFELTNEVLVQQARLVVGNYIYQRLSLKGLMNKRVSVSPYHSVLAEEVFSAGQELERLYPRTYSDVSRRICMTMTSAQLVRRALTSVLEGIFRSGVTWAKVVSMVAMAAAFAEECVVQGHPNFVEDIVMCVGHFVSLNLTGWLARQGGWAAFPTSRPPVTEKAPSSSPLLLLSLVVLGVSIFVFLSRLILYSS